MIAATVLWPQAMQRDEILLCCPGGLTPGDVVVELGRSHDRCCLHASCEDRISSAWDARRATNPKLYNGTKFRLAGFDFRGAEDGLSPKVHVLLGLTDYRDYLGTNLAGHWQELLALDTSSPRRAGHGGRVVTLNGSARSAVSTPPDLSSTSGAVQECDARTGSCLAHPCANAVVLETSDGQVIYLQRSAAVGECPLMNVLPGGHAEPAVLGIETQEQWQALAELPSSERVAAVLWDAALLEIVEETGVPREDLSPPLFIGAARRVENHRPVLGFVVSTPLSAAQVLQNYRDGHVQDRFESTSIHSKVSERQRTSAHPSPFHLQIPNTPRERTEPCASSRHFEFT